MRRLFLFGFLLAALTLSAAATTSSGCVITYNITSDLTGETGITCIECPTASAFYDGWVEAGRPEKVKIIGPFTSLEKAAIDIITYLDLSETVVDGNTLREGDLAYLPGQDDDDVCNIITLVLPDGLTSFSFGTLATYWGNAFFPLKDIYTNNPTPFHVWTSKEMSLSTLFHVPNGSKSAWQEYISSTSDMVVCDTPVKTVTTTKGSLSTKLTSSDIQNVDVLVVNGEVNAKDFVTLSKMKSLTRLDLNASIKGYSGSDGPVASYTVYHDNEIPSYAFTNYSSLRIIYLPSSYQISIGDYAFDGCINLEHFGNNNISSDGFYDGGRWYDNYGIAGKLGDFAFRNTKVGRVWLMGCFEQIGKNPFLGTPNDIIYLDPPERFAHYVINGENVTRDWYLSYSTYLS